MRPFKLPNLGVRASHLLAKVRFSRQSPSPSASDVSFKLGGRLTDDLALLSAQPRPQLLRAVTKLRRLLLLDLRVGSQLSRRLELPSLVCGENRKAR